MSNTSKKHAWTIGKWATLFGLLASIAIIVDSNAFRSCIAPWTDMPEKINAIQSLQAQHYSEYKDDMRAIKRALAIRLNNEYTTNRPMRLSENQN